MAYTQFAEGKPVIAPDTGGDVVDYTRENLAALRDAVIAGVMPGWNLTISTPAQQPTSLVWAKGTLRVRAGVTYGTSGVTQYMPTTALYEFNGNSGIGAWDAMGTLTLIYDGVTGYLQSSSWS